MSFHNAPLICPICANALMQLDRRLACAGGHAFDIAREGYVNLLRQHKKGRILGDAKVMLQARRAFLRRGHYAPVAAAVNQIVGEFIVEPQNSNPFWIADIGCGEGYYLQQLMQQLGRTRPDAVRCCGVDISKEAVRMASRQNKLGAFAVADVNQQIPLANQSVDVLLDLFAPRNAAEFARVLTTGGLLLVVIPTNVHLHEWRAALAQQGLIALGIEPAKEQHVREQFASDFEAKYVQKVCYTIELDQPDLENLLLMTPNAWHLSPAELQKMPQLGPMSTTVSVQLLIFRCR